MTFNRVRYVSKWLCIVIMATAGAQPWLLSHATPAKTSQIDTTAQSRSELNLEKMEEEANKLRLQGDFAGSISIWKQLLEINESTHGPEHLEVAISLNNIAILLASQGKYTTAEPLLRRALAIRERTFGSDHPDVALTLSNLASLLNTLGNYTSAEELYSRSLRIYEKAFGPIHPEVANSLSDLAISLQNQGQLDAAEPLFRRSLVIREKNLGPDHLDVATSLNDLALLLYSQGRYSTAEPLYRRSLAIREKNLGDDHPVVATSLNNLALLLYSLGRYSTAEPLYRRSLAIREKNLGDDHPDVATSLNNLAAILFQQGQYAEAELLFRRSLNLKRKNHSANQRLVALSLNNWALLLHKRGQYEAAEPLFRDALAIYEKALGSDHYETATSINNLAALLIDQGRRIEGEHLLRRSLAARERVLGPGHPDVATSINNLALLLHSQGQYTAAKILYQRALAIREKAFGPDHPDVANSLNNLAGLLCDEGHYATAEPLFRRALAIRERSLYPNHHEVALTLNNLTTLYMATGNLVNAISALNQALAIESLWLLRELPLLQDQLRSAQLRQAGRASETTFSLIANHLSSASQLALKTRLNRQGLLPEIERRQTLLLNSPGIDRNKLELLQALTQQLASVSLPTEGRAAVREQRDRLQSELYRQVPDLQIQSVTTAAVAKSLPADGALVEFQRYQPLDVRRPKDQRWGAAQYIALILKPNGSISAVPLGPAAAIEATVHKGLSSSAEGLSDAEALWAQLSNQVMRPLLPHLSGSRQWFLSPDGELNRVPFAALPAPQQPNTPLAAAVQLRLLTTGRELVRLHQPAPTGRGAVVMANPSYDRHGGRAVVATQSDAAAAVAQRRSADLSSNRWLPLPGTEREGQQVASLLGTRLISGPAATTTALLQPQGPRVLHIATHGFFVADQESEATDPLRTIQEQAPQLRAFRGEEPLLRSGLVLAGANQPDLDPKDDGYLTAAEALTLKLKGTELVVLSACSTAQGDIRTGEGVYGLQRALTVAGARSTLLSLWKVDDAATAEFMTRFYRRLKAGEGRADALAAVQQEFRDGKTGNDAWRSPTYWAAWQLVGDWRPIEGL